MKSTGKITNRYKVKDIGLLSSCVSMFMLVSMLSITVADMMAKRPRFVKNLAPILTLVQNSRNLIRIMRFRMADSTSRRKIRREHINGSG